jgi:hypothetical protein
MTTATQIFACRRWGRSTTLPQLLIKSARSFRLGNGQQFLCPKCVSRDATIYRLVNFTLYAVIAIGFLFMPSTRAGNSPDPLEVFRFIADMVLLEPLMVVAHEAAHAMVGRLVGLRVFGVQLGTGPALAKFWLRDFFVTVHLVPAGGFCFAGMKAERRGRWRIILMVAAGPMVHVLTIGLVVACLRSRLPASFDEVVRGGWVWALVAINALLLLANLLPQDVQRDGQKFANDGKCLLQLARSKSSLNTWLFARYAMEINECLEKGRVVEARQWLDQFLGSGPPTLMRSVIELNVLGAEGKWSEAQEKSIAWQENFSNPLERAALSAWAAVAIGYAGGDLAQSESQCNVAMGILPWDPATQVVQAFVSLAVGRVEEAEKLLKQSGQQNNWAAKAAAAHLWAEICRRNGNARLERKWEARARSLDPLGSFRLPIT